jgi:hypothetical protein
MGATRNRLPAPLACRLHTFPHTRPPVPSERDAISNRTHARTPASHPHNTNISIAVVSARPVRSLGLSLWSSSPRGSSSDFPPPPHFSPPHTTPPRVHMRPPYHHTDPPYTHVLPFPHIPLYIHTYTHVPPPPNVLLLFAGPIIIIFITPLPKGVVVCFYSLSLHLAGFVVDQQQLGGEQPPIGRAGAGCFPATRQVTSTSSRGLLRTVAHSLTSWPARPPRAARSRRRGPASLRSLPLSLLHCPPLLHVTHDTGTTRLLCSASRCRAPSSPLHSSPPCTTLQRSTICSRRRSAACSPHQRSRLSTTSTSASRSCSYRYTLLPLPPHHNTVPLAPEQR